MGKGLKLTTGETIFYAEDHQGNQTALINVTAGAPAMAAIETASCMLECIHDLAIDMGHGKQSEARATAISFLSKIAMALVDSINNDAVQSL